MSATRRVICEEGEAAGTIVVKLLIVWARERQIKGVELITCVLHRVLCIQFPERVTVQIACSMGVNQKTYASDTVSVMVRAIPIMIRHD